ncbi:MAG: AMP-binding protein [Pseudomonadota bacterium]
MSDAPSLTALIQEIEARGDVDCVVHLRDGDLETWSSQRIAQTVRRLADGLRDRGVGPDAVVMMWAPNSAAWIIMALAVGLAGGVLMPIDEQALEDAPHILKESGAMMVATDLDHARDLRAGDMPDAVQLVFLDGADETQDGVFWETLFEDLPEELPWIDPETPAVLTFTSGTTGMPKSFTLSHANLLQNARNIRDASIAIAGDRAALPLPLHHAYPYVIGMLSPLITGSAIVLPEAPTGPKIIEALRRADVTILLGVPRLYDAIVGGLDANLDKRPAPIRAVFKSLQRLSSSVQRRFGWPVGQVLLLPLRRALAPKLRLLVSGGAPLDPHINARLEALGWMVCSGYGLSETASVFTTNVPQARKIGSAGRVLGEGELRILEPDESGIGEITVRGPSVFEGYRQNPEANREAFVEGDWFRTGDLGYVDAEGYLFITGRAKELIVLGGGKKINPEDLEKAYLEQPAIAEIGLLEHNGALAALVRPDSDAIRYRGSTQVRHAVGVAIKEVGQHQPAYARPGGFQIVGEPLPRTRLGKLRRFMLPELYRAHLQGKVSTTPVVLSEADKELLHNPQAAQALEFLKKRYPDQQVVPDTNLQLDLGIDSFGWMTLSLELQEGLDVQLSEDRVASIQTVRDLLQAVTETSPSADEFAAVSATDGVPLDPEQWLQPTGPIMTGLGVFAHKLVWAVMRLFFSLKVEGLENVPPTGALIITPNHVSDLDPLVVAAALPTSRLRQTYWAGDLTRLFATRAWRFFSRLAHIFPVDERRPGAAMEAAETVLKSGKTQVWFPEGWRSPDGELQRFMPGIGRVMLQANASALPVLIEGAFEAMPRDRRWPRRHPIKVTFGVVATPEKLRQEGHGGSPEERIANGIKNRIATMAGHEQREAA